MLWSLYGCVGLHRCHLLLLLLNLNLILSRRTILIHVDDDASLEALLASSLLRLLSARRRHLLVLLWCRVLLLEFLCQLLVLSHDHGLLHGNLVMLSVQVSCGRVRHWYKLLLLMIEVLLRQLLLLCLISTHGLIAIDLREPLLLDRHALLAATLPRNIIVKTHILR